VRITPDSNIAGIELGATFLEVQQLMGDPRVRGLIMDYPDLGLRALMADVNGNRVADATDTVIEVAARAPFVGLTAGGNGVGSDLLCVEAEFGPAGGGGGLVYDDLGIEFIGSNTINSSTRVDQIVFSSLTDTPVSVSQVVVFFRDVTVASP
jgi:hypothetical protein